MGCFRGLTGRFWGSTRVFGGVDFGEMAGAPEARKASMVGDGGSWVLDLASWRTVLRAPAFSGRRGNLTSLHRMYRFECIRVVSRMAGWSCGRTVATELPAGPFILAMDVTDEKGTREGRAPHAYPPVCCGSQAGQPVGYA